MVGLVTTASWGCLDFKRAYERYCAAPGRCQTVTDPDAGECKAQATDCTGAFDCCEGLACNRGAGASGTCQSFQGTHLPDGWACYASDQCSSGLCNDAGVCETVVCRVLDASCTFNACCPQLTCRTSYPSGCTQPTGSPCTLNDYCEELNCEDGLCAPCKAEGASCTTTGSCCSGNCHSGSCAACIVAGPLPPPDARCSDNLQCCDKRCESGRCCKSLYSYCSNDLECCSNRCGDNGSGAITCLDPL